MLFQLNNIVVQLPDLVPRGDAESAKRKRWERTVRICSTGLYLRTPFLWRENEKEGQEACLCTWCWDATVQVL